MNPENETSYTTQYQNVLRKYLENESCAKPRHAPVIKPESVASNNLFPSAMANGSSQSSFDPYNLSTHDKENLTRHNEADTTPGQSDHTARLLNTARLFLNSPSEPPKNWGQINPNRDEYHSNPMEISSTFWIPDITDRWHQQDEMHSKYADLSDVACNICTITPHVVRVEATISVGRDVMGWRESNPTGETLRETVGLRQFAQANHGIFVGDNPALDTTNTENHLEVNKEAKERKLHRMAKVHDILEMWRRSQNLHAIQEEYRAQNMQMTAMRYISDTEEIVKESWSLFLHDGAAAFKLSERSPLPPALSAQNLPEGRTEILNVSRIRRIDRHPAQSNEGSAPESIWDTENWLNWNYNLDDPHGSEDDCEADLEPDIEPFNCIEVPEYAEQRDMCALPNVA